MTVLSRRVNAALRVVPRTSYVAGRTVVAVAPSDADPIWNQMRVAANGVLISRDFDPGQEVVTGAPIPYVTTSGEPYVTMTGEPYVTVVE